MQKLEMFTIHDCKAEAFITPFFLPNDAMAIRSFADCINSTGTHQFSQSPADYTLFNLGTFDVSEATISLLDAPRSMGNGVQFKKAKIDLFDDDQPPLKDNGAEPNEKTT